MKKKLVILMIIAVLMVSCVRIGSTSQSQKPSGNTTDTTGAMAQNPGGMQSLPGVQPGSSGNLPSLQPGGQSGSMNGFNQPSLPPGTPVSPAIDQFNLSGQGGSQSSSMGALPASGSAGAQPPGAADQGPSQQNNAPAGLATLKPYFEVGGDLYADTPMVNVGDSVFLGWRVANADDYTLEQDGKIVLIIPRDRVGTIVVPDVPGINKYTLTAKNAGGSVSQSVEISALSKGQREVFDRSQRCRTFLVYPQKIKKGEPVYVYWNVLDAQNVFIQNDFTGNLSDKPDIRDIVQPYGMEQYWPYQNTDFKLTHGSGPYSSSTYGTGVCYVDVQ